MPYDRVDLGKIALKPLASRDSKWGVEDIRYDATVSPPDPGANTAAIERLVARIQSARDAGAAVIQPTVPTSSKTVWGRWCAG